MALRVGVDIGGTNVRIGVVEGNHIIHEQRTQADFSKICKSNSAEIAWKEIIEVIREALTSTLNSYPRVESIGIGFPGFIDPKTGVLASSPNLPGLLNVDLAGALSVSIHRPVIVENDALAAAFGEYVLSHGSSNQGLIYLGLGTGVGGGLVQAGKPFAGEHGFAMEVGHIITEPDGRLCGCGNKGCMEQYASASGISLSYQAVTSQVLPAHEIALLAVQGDANAQAAYDVAAKALARALAHIVKVVDVERVVIGGGVSQAWPLMASAFNQQLNQDLIPVLRGRLDISISTAQDKAGIVGAAFLSAI